ncbi:MAG: hypothetical protein ABSF15_28825 [Candidatus Sulfotelmatobacter sp.]|jgi:hypothetical protein
MQYPDRIEIARKNMVQAEAAVESYLQIGVPNIEQHKQLTDALKVSREEYVDKIERLFPKMR